MMGARTLVGDIRDLDRTAEPVATVDTKAEPAAPTPDTPPGHSPDPLYGHSDHYRLAVPSYPIEQFLR